MQAVNKPTPQEIEQEQRRKQREKALEYAKNVPKPKVVPVISEVVIAPVTRITKPQKPTEFEELADLLELHDELHEQISQYYQLTEWGDIVGVLIFSFGATKSVSLVIRWYAVIHGNN